MAAAAAKRAVLHGCHVASGPSRDPRRAGTARQAVNGRQLAQLPGAAKTPRVPRSQRRLAADVIRPAIPGQLRSPAFLSSGPSGVPSCRGKRSPREGSWKLRAAQSQQEDAARSAEADAASPPEAAAPPPQAARAEAGLKDHVEEGEDATWQMWDRSTNTLTACSTVTNLLFLLPQILKNLDSLLAGHPAELAGLSWVGFTAGFLGNWLCLSYFAGKKQTSACLVQAVGGTSTLVLLSQLWLADVMPTLPYSAVCGYYLLGGLVNALRYTDRLPQGAWAVWLDVIGIVGLSLVPQVLWYSFSSYETSLPGAAAALAGVGCIVAIRTGTAPPALVDTWQKLSGWTANGLFMLMPVAQLSACLVNPANLATLSPFSYCLGLVGNGLMIPRALFTRDLIWFIGVAWGALILGWATLLDLAIYDYFPMPLFCGVSALFFSYVAGVLYMNAKVHKLTSPLESFRYLRP